MSSLNEIIIAIQNDQVVAYPTEAVFGLGCNPNSESAVQKLLQLKKRPVEKGLILVAPSLAFLRPYIDESLMSETEWQRLAQISDQATTWVVPAKNTTPSFITGNFKTVAVRICPVPAVEMLCQAVGFPLVSTSANLSGFPPCRTANEVRQQFGDDFLVLDAPTLGKQNPSEIRDIFSQSILRKG